MISRLNLSEMYPLILPNLPAVEAAHRHIRLVSSIYPTCLDIIQPSNKDFRDDGVGQNNGSWGLDITVLSIKL